MWQVAVQPPSKSLKVTCFGPSGSLVPRASPAAGTGCMDLGVPLIPSHNSPWAGFVAEVLPWRGSAHYSRLAELPENSAIRNIPLGTLVWGGTQLICLALFSSGWVCRRFSLTHILFFIYLFFKSNNIRCIFSGIVFHSIYI